MGLFKYIYLMFRTILSMLAVVPIAIWRIKWLRYSFILLLLAGLGVTYLFYGKLPAPVTTYDVVWLDQGWTDDQRQKYYQTDQGTLIMPYSWFLALERPPTFTRFVDNFKLFRDNDNISRYRLIPDPRPKYNPDGLPIGVTKTIVPDDLLDLGLGHKEWLSFSCAACHTGQITYKGLAIRIDGMPAMWNFSDFSSTMTADLITTRFLPTKFDRFAKKVLEREGRPNTEAEREKLKKEIDQYRQWPLIKDAIRSLEEKTYPTKEGPGRTDALSRGGNGQFAVLDDEVNTRVGNSPVSFPPVWYTHEYDWVQSTTGIRQPLGRNVTESWGVNVIVDITNSDPKMLFRSTHPLEKLFWIETLLSVLEHPRWPEDIFGKIKPELAEHGRKLYEEAVWDNPRNPRNELYCGGTGEPPCNEERISRQQGYCARCHSPVREPVAEDTPPCDPATDVNCKKDAALFQLPLYRLDVIGTDPWDAKNFNARVGTMSPGNGTFRNEFAKSEFADQSKSNLGFGIGNGLQFVTTNTMNWWFERNKPLMDQWVAEGIFPNAEIGRRTMEGFRSNIFRAPLAYPARPMAGYWATPPYLHNHSVLNMYQLLIPASERSTSFYIGNTEYEPEKLGFESGWFDRGFKFDNSVTGNSNAGHEFSHKPGDPAKPGVIGPLLSEYDRMAIVEYMKIIDDVPELTEQEATRRRQLLAAMKPHFEGQVSEQYKRTEPNFAPVPEASGTPTPVNAPAALPSPLPSGEPPISAPAGSPSATPTATPSASPSASPGRRVASYLKNTSKATPGVILLIMVFFVYRRVRA